MARFVSPYLQYSIQARPEKTRLTADGFAFMDQGLLMCDFEPASLKDWEREVALQHFDFRGVPDGIENPGYRLSLFDTTQHGWDDETRALVEERLRSVPNFGHDFIELIRPKLSAPWPNYDQIVASQGPKSVAKIIADKVREDGYDVQYVIDYEEENANREPVLAALRALQLPEEDEIAA